jgi:hypothetical protein
MKIVQRGFQRGRQLKMWSWPSKSYALLFEELHKIPGVTSRGFTTADAVSPVLHMAERRPSYFNLLAGEPTRRPFSGFVAAFIVELSPSGVVPGDYSGGRAVDRIVILGGEGPDCSFYILCRVLSVIVEGLVVILFTFEVLHVKCYPTE